MIQVDRRAERPALPYSSDQDQVPRCYPQGLDGRDERGHDGRYEPYQGAMGGQPSEGELLFNFSSSFSLEQRWPTFL